MTKAGPTSWHSACVPKGGVACPAQHRVLWTLHPVRREAKVDAAGPRSEFRGQSPGHRLMGKGGQGLEPLGRTMGDGGWARISVAEMQSYYFYSEWCSWLHSLAEGESGHMMPPNPGWCQTCVCWSLYHKAVLGHFPGRLVCSSRPLSWWQLRPQGLSGPDHPGHLTQKVW